MRKVRILPNHSKTISGRVDGESYTVEFNEKGEATVKNSVADHLVHTFRVAEFVADEEKKQEEDQKVETGKVEDKKTSDKVEDDDKSKKTEDEKTDGKTPAKDKAE